VDINKTVLNFIILIDLESNAYMALVLVEPEPVEDEHQLLPLVAPIESMTVTNIWPIVIHNKLIGKNILKALVEKHVTNAEQVERELEVEVAPISM